MIIIKNFIKQRFFQKYYKRKALKEKLSKMRNVKPTNNDFILDRLEGMATIHAEMTSYSMVQISVKYNNGATNNYEVISLEDFHKKYKIIED